MDPNKQSSNSPNQFTIPSGEKDGVGPSVPDTPAVATGGPGAPDSSQQQSDHYPVYSQPTNDPTQVSGVPPLAPQAYSSHGLSANQIVPPDTTPGIPSSPPPRTKRSYINKRVIMIALAIVFVGVGGTLGVLYISNQESVTTNQEQEAATEEVDSENGGKDIKFSSSDLIRAVTILISEDTYKLDSLTENILAGGCRFTGTYSVEKTFESSYSRVADSAEGEEEESCRLAGVSSLYLETYSVDGIVYNRQKSTDSFEELGSESIAARADSPQEILSEFLPYPTLLVVEKAQESSDGQKVVNVVMNLGDEKTLYTFTLDINNKIVFFTIERETPGDHGKSKLKSDVEISYMVDPIIAPVKDK